ncbi:glycoprotein endo-alpha-1,2-mannosidase-like [Clavelina lepadiformis]|uniref:glycoprotein endo-alpha-1,2-mannosidase-like n=1 Tax=Clavelina lepadiformis TaxID=159417 RepID=UPI0040430C79
MVRIYARKYTVLVVVILFIFFGVLVFIASNVKSSDAKKPNHLSGRIHPEKMSNKLFPPPEIVPADTNEAKQQQNILIGNKVNDELQPKLEVNHNVHAFYYAWYGNEATDGKYSHWNHPFLPHWEKRISELYATGKTHKPPDDIGANFYPLLGAYSSRDPVLLRKHMEQFVLAKIGVLVLSWYPPEKADEEGSPASEQFIHSFLKLANAYNLKVCFHIEPYAGRNASSVKEDLKHIIEQYGSHPAFYRTKDPRQLAVNARDLPLVYVYDSYLTPAEDWNKILTHKESKNSIRGTEYDALVIGLFVERAHKETIRMAGFDGFYTYFASSGFTYGSKQANWMSLKLYARDENLIFIPSIGPGYIDTNVRPWNDKNTKHRDNGNYYETSWKKAVEGDIPSFISITSFNEWHEGTQIEPAMSEKSVFVDHILGKPKSGTFQYESYGKNPDLYLDLTRNWVEIFTDMKH